jgi:hypothetical protein
VPEDWTAEDGGALDLFASENGKPTKVAKSICPSFNAFAFFEVSPASFHQVNFSPLECIFRRFKETRGFLGNFAYFFMLGGSTLSSPFSKRV